MSGQQSASDYDTFDDLTLGDRMNGQDKISSGRFYGEYHGHPIQDLEILLPKLRESTESLIWTAGDSSLDNKHWFPETAPSVGVYGDVLRPPRSVCDVTYWLNHLSLGSNMAAINTAVEATTVNERTLRLRHQDMFLRDHIGEDDILVVSVGGNDVAMMPSPCTIANIYGLLSLPATCIENTISCGVVPVDDYCCGCCSSVLSCSCTCPPCSGYFRHLFGTRVESYIRKLVSKTKPKMILVCMIYYPDENHVPSWANLALGALGYNNTPQKLQLMIRTTFQYATSNIRIDGTQVVPVPLFHVLDGKRSEDYVARVEPSAIGGKKMAEFILDAIQQSSSGGLNSSSSAAPSASYMQERG